MGNAMDAAEAAVGEAVSSIAVEDRPFSEEGVRGEVTKGVEHTIAGAVSEGLGESVDECRRRLRGILGEGDAGDAG